MQFQEIEDESEKLVLCTDISLMESAMNYFFFHFLSTENTDKTQQYNDEMLKLD